MTPDIPTQLHDILTDCQRVSDGAALIMLIATLQTPLTAITGDCLVTQQHIAINGVKLPGPRTITGYASVEPATIAALAGCRALELWSRLTATAASQWGLTLNDIRCFAIEAVAIEAGPNLWNAVHAYAAGTPTEPAAMEDVAAAVDRVVAAAGYNIEVTQNAKAA